MRAYAPVTSAALVASAAARILGGSRKAAAPSGQASSMADSTRASVIFGLAIMMIKDFGDDGDFEI